MIPLPPSIGLFVTYVTIYRGMWEGSIEGPENSFRTLDTPALFVLLPPYACHPAAVARGIGIVVARGNTRPIPRVGTSLLPGATAHLTEGFLATIITLLNQKGGVGKTSTCHHLAGTLPSSARSCWSTTTPSRA